MRVNLEIPLLAYTYTFHYLFQEYYSQLNCVSQLPHLESTKFASFFIRPTHMHLGCCCTKLIQIPFICSQQRLKTWHWVLPLIVNVAVVNHPTKNRSDFLICHYRLLQLPGSGMQICFWQNFLLKM